MRDEANLEEVKKATQHLPLQVAPVMRTAVNSPISGDMGVEACDNDHNLFVFGPGCGCCGKSSTATGG